MTTEPRHSDATSSPQVVIDLDDLRCLLTMYIQSGRKRWNAQHIDPIYEKFAPLTAARWDEPWREAWLRDPGDNESRSERS